MRQLALVAVGTLRQRLCCQMIVGAAFGCTCLGMTPFRIWHETLSTKIAGIQGAIGTLVLQLLLDLGQGFPAGIAGMLLTLALLDVQVATALRA